MTLFQLGIAVGFLFPPMLVKSSDDLAVIGEGLQLMYYIVAAISSVILVLILLCKYKIITLCCIIDKL